ncbi:MAG: hypothetical protein V4604_01470 [Bacteroidota bacterium]
MYQTLTLYHSWLRWLILAFLLYSIYLAWRGIKTKKNFSKTDNFFRHWTATLFHIQLIIGIILYVKSPMVSYFWRNFTEAIQHIEIAFFGLIHLLLMISVIVMVTIGSALAKRRQTDLEKFKTMLWWFGIALIVLLIAIPWPFSPFAHRPFFR